MKQKLSAFEFYSLVIMGALKVSGWEAGTAHQCSVISISFCP